jgi:hypothetical protein
VDQTVFSFDANPGEQKTFTVNVKNISKDAEQVSLQFQDFTIGDNNAIQTLTQKNELSGMSEWISVGEKNMMLDPGEDRNIEISVAIPQDATVGSHFALASLGSLPPITGQNFQSTIISGQVGIYVLVNVGGKISGSGNIKKFEAPVITDKQTILKTEFENTGNIHYIPHGEVRIENLFTRQIQNVEVEKHFVFPGKNYLFELTWDKASPFGAYWAQALFVDGDSSVHVSGRLFFGRFFFVIVALLVGILVLIYVLRKRILAIIRNIRNIKNQ